MVGQMKNILLLNGGGSTEHEISIISSEFILSQIDQSKYNVLCVEIDDNFNWSLQGETCELSFQKYLLTKSQEFKIDMAIPCFHGFPGETGDIQSLFELIKLPYLGCNSETSVVCFNKLLTKLTLENAGIKTTPFIQINSSKDTEEALSFFNIHKSIFVKATNQGSSVGCYRVNDKNDLIEKLELAFQFSPHVILEKEIIGRELEVALFEHDGDLNISNPGEIICPSEFYTYEEKYSSESQTKTHIEAKNISEKITTEIIEQSLKAYDCLKLRHLSRIDFFLSEKNEVLINEVNTFPGHTNISMFPAMMANMGINYKQFINQKIEELAQN
jgi:D-alanine-D-alanine ligase